MRVQQLLTSRGVQRRTWEHWEHPTLPDLTLGEVLPLSSQPQMSFLATSPSPARPPPLFPLNSFAPLGSCTESQAALLLAFKANSHTVNISPCNHPLPHSPLLPDFSLGLPFWFLLVLLSPTGVGQASCLLCKRWGVPRPQRLSYATRHG